ncbi:hypothetical protein AY599_02145 [Leptolyngbya valderiana BDU 20041]|nr:hypothetical protein AY599_02145 [Leptolyngbya valderiana BDU 20041]
MHVIAGMHRSGTSFAAQVIHELGGDFGAHDRLFAADVWNQKGYFESRDVVDVNNKMVLGLNADLRHWVDAPADRIGRTLNAVRSMKWKYFLFPRVERILSRAPALDEAMQTLAREYDGKFVKDPRFCLTIEAWRDIGAVESLVFSFRHPVSVAGSLKRREGLPTAFGLRYWRYHVHNFLKRAPRDVPITVIDFDRFFDIETRDAALSQVADFMGAKADREALSRVLDIRLRTQTAAPAIPLADIAETYKICRALHAATKHGPVRLGDVDLPGGLALP